MNSQVTYSIVVPVFTVTCKTIATVMSFVVNYIGSKFWVFRDEEYSYAR
ncbi:hypothetical protein Desca_0546 [Desulfotomaculum nigrificans CO-1-SRB]|uniref:GtrA/DPMS transmembrane domain-containing protein n=1 Tax=Desulfotomaculum nigrificans (strain DSM 14880 / VKM B-2319 / CO-1-SRB) TaxID=868595 RepID=F6B7R6_DESCC|nr:hypothetical protein [Desulfotomaculum nigrificans]AEF93438.1 hypothetical protein Desca_0546 [Desulfotomaculum nigrificans CO-1-SRB]